MEYVVSFPGLGWEFTINRVAFTIAGINVYWYGLLIATGLMLAVLFAFRHAVEFGIDADRLIDVVCIGTIMAIICARVYYVAMSPYAYDSLWDMIDIRQGGIAIYGALIGAFVFGALACRWRKVPILPTFDLVAMGFLIGQCLGRWGNFVNQEAFGYNTTLPWGMYSEKTREYLESSVVTLPAGMTVDPTAPVHPTFFYESVWCLVGFILLALYFKKRRFDGDVALRYAIWYGLGRFWIEGLRTDSLLLVPSLGLRASQLVAAVTVVAALAMEVWLTRKYKDQQPLQVRLAISSENLKRKDALDGPVGVILTTPEGKDASCLPVNASHAEFVAATDRYNQMLKEALKQVAAQDKQMENTSAPAPAEKTEETPTGPDGENA